MIKVKDCEMGFIFVCSCGFDVIIFRGVGRFELEEMLCRKYSGSNVVISLEIKIVIGSWKR